MFEKRKEKRTLKKNGDVAELIGWRETSLRKIDQQLTEGAATTDAAEKILKFQKLIRDIGRVGFADDKKQREILNRRNGKKAYKIAGATAATGVTAVGISAGILFPPALLFMIPAAASGMLTGAFSQLMMSYDPQKLLEKNPHLKDFSAALAARENSAHEMLNEIVKNCNLEEISLSARRDEVLCSSPTLRKRFADAVTASAKQTLEEKAAQREATQAADKKPGGRGPYKSLEIF
jgi:hypothetical protein